MYVLAVSLESASLRRLGTCSIPRGRVSFRALDGVHLHRTTMTRRATLCIVNLTEAEIYLTVEQNSVSGFAAHDPSIWLKNQYLASGSSHGDFVELEDG